MEYASITAINIYITLFALMVILIPTAIIFNIRTGIRYRQKLAHRLDQLRISRMLKALGIDTTQYLHQQRIHTITTQMTRCQECQHTDQCDEALTTGSINLDNITYCNNDESLHEIVARQE